MKKNSSDYKIRRADASLAPSPPGFRRIHYFNAYGPLGTPPAQFDWTAVNRIDPEVEETIVRDLKASVPYLLIAARREVYTVTVSNVARRN